MATEMMDATEESIRVTVAGGTEVTAVRGLPEGSPAGWVFVYAPGAGSNLNDGFGSYACRRLASQGFLTVRFQFPYMEARKRRPDSPAVLLDTWRAVIGTLPRLELKLVVGGRSMGGRIASQVVSQGTDVDALALFAYPLHPPAKPDQRRDQHFPRIGVRTLFCSGTRDAFATPEELQAASSLVPYSSVHLLEGADHGFSVPKSSGPHPTAGLG